MGAVRWTADIEEWGPAAAVVLTDDQVTRLGGGRRAPVRVTIGGRTARLRLAVMGGHNVIGLSRAARDELGVAIGDVTEVEVALDDEPRVVQVPPELDQALARAEDARDAYDRLAYTHRREYARWVAEAKRPETRVRRAERAVQMLREGRVR